MWCSRNRIHVKYTDSKRRNLTAKSYFTDNAAQTYYLNFSTLKFYFCPLYNGFLPSKIRNWYLIFESFKWQVKAYTHTIFFNSSLTIFYQIFNRYIYIFFFLQYVQVLLLFPLINLLKHKSLLQSWATNLYHSKVYQHFSKILINNVPFQLYDVQFIKFYVHC